MTNLKSQISNQPIALALHGGAGTITRALMDAEKENRYKAALQAALDAGYAVLENGGTALDAVETTVNVLEDSPLFNAGRGSVFTNSGTHEMDASIMDGKTREAGAVAAITGVKNPISLAREIMEKSGHVMLAGQGAADFAKAQGFEFLPEDYFYDDFRYRQWQEAKASGAMQLDHTPLNEKKFGTVGAVALDAHGNIAAATSTGGMTNKKYGRVGDSPVIGAGTYANNRTCAVSCTGSGEFFLRSVVAYDVSCLMEMKGLSLEEACNETVHKRLLELNGDGGLIAVDAAGNISLSFNTEGMYRAAKSSLGVDLVEIYK
jgi:beta-aspartyl-peptidase (threonine type)